MTESLPLICNECGCNAYKLYPDPRDSKQEIMVCEDCEYAITAKYDSLDNEPIENYEDVRGK